MLLSSFHTFLLSYPFTIPVVVGVSTEIIKVLVECAMHRSWKGGFFRPGGMPSSHASFAASLIVVIAHMEGLESSAFVIAVVIAMLTWYDAAGSRHAIGEQAKVLNALQGSNKLSERMGHSVFEVIAGITLGSLMTIGLLLSRLTS